MELRPHFGDKETKPMFLQPAKWRQIMTGQRIIIITIAAMFTAIGSQAEDVALLNGYGSTKWGQSKEEVTAAVPDLEEDDSIKHVEILQQPGEDGGVIQYTNYVFIDDTLFRVSAFYKMPGAPEDGPDKAGLAFIREKLAAKYDAAKSVLKPAGIDVRATNVESGIVRVTYYNTKIEDEVMRQRKTAAKEDSAREKAEAEAAEEKAFRESARYKTMEAIDIKDGL